MVGVNVAVVPENAITPAIGTFPSLTVNVAIVIVKGSIGSVKTTLTGLLREMLPAASEGLTLEIVGHIPTNPCTSVTFLHPINSKKENIAIIHLFK
jgi:hypothetical protein